MGLGQQFHKHRLSLPELGTEQGPEDKVGNRMEPSPCWAHRDEDWTDRKLTSHLLGGVGGGVGGPEKGLDLGPEAPGGPERVTDSE